VHRLYDAFSAAGGFSQRAGSTIAISHRNQTGEPQVVKLSNDAVQSAKNNIELQPGDTVVVSRAGIVYVVGEVVRPGGFVIDNPAGMTASQVLAMASGPTRTASLNKVQLIRKSPTGLENKVVDLKKVLSAKADDIPLQSDDIIYVPASRGKMALEHGASSALSMITSLAIYHF
jgi:polysaccharide export outer membrane protein